MKRYLQVALLIVALTLTPSAWATFPSVASCTSSSRATNSTSDSVTLPSSIASGDLVIILHAKSGGTGTRTWGTFTELKDANAESTINMGVAYLIAAGGETSETVTTSLNNQFSAIACRITGWHGTTPPEISTGASGGGSTPNPDAVTASWGSDDNLYMVLLAWSNNTLSSYPTSYADNQTSNTAISQAHCALATRNLAASSDDPGTWTIAWWESYWTGTVVIRPAAAGGGGAVSYLPLRGVGD